MTHLDRIVGVRPAARPAWASLTAALDDLAEAGRRPPCATHPDDWGTDAALRTRRTAAEACSWCPVVDACGAYADVAHEIFHVWGGRDRGQDRNRPRGST